MNRIAVIAGTLSPHGARWSIPVRLLRRIEPPATLTGGRPHHCRVRPEASTAAPHQSDRPCSNEPREGILESMAQDTTDDQAVEVAEPPVARRRPEPPRVVVPRWVQMV